MASLGNTAVHGILDVIDSIHVGRQKATLAKYDNTNNQIVIGGTTRNTKIQAPAIIYGDKNINYGTTLPTTKYEGQLFFKIVDIDSAI